MPEGLGIRALGTGPAERHGSLWGVRDFASAMEPKNKVDFPFVKQCQESPSAVGAIGDEDLGRAKEREELASKPEIMGLPSIMAKAE